MRDAVMLMGYTFIMKSSHSPAAAACIRTTQSGARCKHHTANASGDCGRHTISNATDVIPVLDVTEDIPSPLPIPNPALDIVQRELLTIQNSMERILAIAEGTCGQDSDEFRNIDQAWIMLSEAYPELEVAIEADIELAKLFTDPTQHNLVVYYGDFLCSCGNAELRYGDNHNSTYPDDADGVICLRALSQDNRIGVIVEDSDEDKWEAYDRSGKIVATSSHL